MSDTIYHIAQPDGSTRQATVMEITQEIKAGTITQETPLWCSSWTDWRNCGTIPFFAPFFKETSAPPPSPYRPTPPPPLRNTRHKTKPWMWIVGIGAGAIGIVLFFAAAVCNEITEKMGEIGERIKPFEAFSAAGNGQTKVLSELLNDGADPNIMVDGMTPLMVACLNGKISCAKLLIEHGADLSIHVNNDPSRITALEVAIEADKPKCLEVLLNSGANPNRRHLDTGVTPLMYASAMGKVECVRLLIRAGANVHARADNGVTALDIAVQKGELECAKLLRAAGATD